MNAVRWVRMELAKSSRESQLEARRTTAWRAMGRRERKARVKMMELNSEGIRLVQGCETERLSSVRRQVLIAERDASKEGDSGGET